MGILRIILLAVSLMICLSTGAAASSLCAWLSGATREDGRLPVDLTEADCKPGIGVVCTWTFPFRAEAATETRETLERAITDCPGLSDLRPDVSVNHPDTHDAVLFRLAGHRWNLSLKDKSSLNKTFLFLRTIP